MTTYKTSITGTTPFADYQFKVRATNQQGVGEWSMQSAAAQFNFNKATGGNLTGTFTVTQEMFDNQTGSQRNARTTLVWDGPGEEWAWHEFHSTNEAGLIVEANPRPFRVVCVGNGSGGGGGGPYCANAGPGAWGASLDELTTNVVIGENRVQVGTSMFAGLTAAASNNGAKISTDIKGTKVTYAAPNGAGGGCGNPGGNGHAGQVPGGAGGGGGGVGNGPPDIWTGGGGGPGARGVVIVAYRIG